MTNEPPADTPDPDGSSAPGADGRPSLAERLRRVDWRIPGAIALGGVILVAVLVVALGGSGGDGDATAAAQVTPAGAEAPRLGPIVVSFASAPASQEASHLVSIEPAPPGEFVWLDDRTLLFQPDFPGLLRGAKYRVTVRGVADGGADLTQEFTVEGKLDVRSVIPADGDSDVPSEARIFVQFSRAVAPLTLLSEASTAPVVSFAPPLAGEGEWLNTSLYAFTPTDLRPSTTYRATVAAGLSSAADGVLEDDFTWTFATFQPALATSSPADGTSFVPRDTSIELVFNQPMAPAASEQVVLSSTDGASVSHAASWSEDGTTLTLLPATLLDLSTEYHVDLPNGLAGDAGGETRSARRVSFRTVDPPRVASTSPGDGESGAGRWGISIEFNNPMDTESVEDALAISGVDREDWSPAWYGDRSLQLNIGLEPSTTYTVRLGEGVVDRSGLAMPPHTFTFTTGALEPGVHFATPGELGTFRATGTQELLLWATNVDSVDLTLHRVTDAEAAEYLANGGWKAGPDRPIRTLTLPVDREENVPILLSVSLGEETPLEPGYYWVTSDRAPHDYGSSLFFTVADTTLVTKLALDELLVWAVDTETGDPVPDLELEVSGPQVSGSMRTDADGIATIAVPRPGEVSDRQRRYVVTTGSGSRFGAAHTDMTAGAEDYLLGVPVVYWDQQVVGHVYTDRPIYRSGETVEFKAVVRNDRDATYTLPEPGLTGLHVLVIDAQGEGILREPVTVNEYGTFAGSVRLPEEAPTGFYTVTLVQRADGWENWLTSTAFQVAEFRTPEFRVEMTPDRAEVVDGDTIEVDLEASFFFGGPLAGVAIEWSAFAYPTGVSFEGYERYSFTDFDAFQDAFADDPQRGAGETVTGTDGYATIALPGVLRADESTMEFSVSATVLDESGQAIGADTSVTVHPSSVYAGVTPDEYIGRVGQPTDVLVAAVDTGGEPVAGQVVAVEVFEREWSTVLEETSTGERRYVSTPRDTLIDTRSVTTGADGLGRLTTTPERTGVLRFVARTNDAQGRVARAAAYLWVAGNARAAWPVDNDNVIKLVADADSYRVGDVAEVLVPAPYEGTQALITVERGGVLSREVRFVDSNTTVVEVPVEDRHVPNVFVSVVLYRAPTEADPVPRYHVGSVELPVSTERRLLNVELEPGVERAQPGDTVEYAIRVTDVEGRPVQAELSVAMVDAAVLSLSDYVDQDGLQAFWFQRGLGVRTASSASLSVERNNDTVSEPALGGKGGGGDEASAFRTQFRNTAYWAPQVETDADGRATVSIPLPDNLTTWRTQVRAVSGDTLVGEATHELLSTTPLLVRPALPRFLRVGDEVALRTLVRNATDAPQEVTVTISADGVTLDSSEVQTRLLQAGESGDFSWPARATAEGMATVGFTALAGEMSDAARVQLPVALDVTPETVATGGVVEDESAIEAIYLPPYAITDRGSLEVAVQASIVGVLVDELGALAAYPDESTVRTAARVIATIAAHKAEGHEGMELVAPVEDDLRRLEAVQLPGDGGWGYCARGCRPNPVVTAWVLLAFGDATDAGWSSPAPAATRGVASIRAYLNRVSDVAEPVDPNEEAFLHYALQRARGDATLTNTLRSLYEQDRERLTPWGQTYLLLALLAAEVPADDAMVRGLLADLNTSVIPSANGNHWEAAPIYGSIESNVSMTALVLRALVAADPEHPLIEETARWLVAARDARRWQSDVQRAQAISGLGAYAALTGERSGDFDFRVLLDGGEVLGGHLAAGRAAGGGAIASFDRVELPLAGITRGAVHRLGFERERGDGRLYYVLNLRYLTPATEVESVSRGLSVAREYTLVSDPGRPISQAHLGDLVRVRVTVVADADRKFVQVADLLPAGLEALDTQLATVPDDIRRQLDEERRQAVDGDGGEGTAAPWYRWYWSPWDQKDVRDDRFTLFATELPRGVHEYVYYARATAVGNFFVAPATAEEAPFPEVFGRSDSGRFLVRP